MNAETTAIVVRPVADPAILEPLASRARDYIEAAHAPNTRRAYHSDWKHFTAWCAGHGLQALPAAAETVAMYLSDLAETHKPATIGRKLVTIGQAHKADGHESPTEAAPVRAVWKGIRRVFGTAPDQKAAAVTEDIRAMVATLDESPMGRRDRALLLVGFAGALRRSELVALDRADVLITREGVTLSIRHSKTDQEGEGAKVAILNGRNPETCPVKALAVWLRTLKAHGHEGGAVFRPVDRHGNIGDGRLSGYAVALIVKRTATAAGLDPDTYAGHSLRSGFITSAARNQVSERLIMRQSRHKSERVMRGYIRDAGLFQENASASVGL